MSVVKRYTTLHIKKIRQFYVIVLFLNGAYTVSPQTTSTVTLFLGDLTCNIPWESFNTGRLSKYSMQLFSMIRIAVGRLKSIKRKKTKLSALQRFPSDEADRKST